MQTISISQKLDNIMKSEYLMVFNLFTSICFNAY